LNIEKIRHKLYVYPWGQPIQTPVKNSGCTLNFVIYTFPINAFFAHVKYREIWDSQEGKCFMSVHNSDPLLSINCVQNLVSVNKLSS